MSFLKIQNMHFGFNEHLVLKGIDLELKQGQILGVMGFSGSGKTTLLRCISGFEKPQQGEICLKNNILFNGQVFVPPQQRNIGFVFQDYALFPHLTVQENILFSSNNKPNELYYEIIEALQIANLKLRFPEELSAGQKQRTALARSLFQRPYLLLMDEPFANLDLILRNQAKKIVSETLKKFAVTAIVVIHDPREAYQLVDQLILLEDGIIVQSGTIHEIRKNPTRPWIDEIFAE